jgi:DNA polymerase-3 subunit alpha
MESLSVASHNAEQALRNQTLGQHDLFGAANPETPKIEYVNAQKWSDQVRLLGEKETLGLYLTGHPIHRYLDELKHFTTNRVAELRPTQNKSTTAAGIISSVRVIQTKRGDRMAVASIEDGSGQIDILCFSETYHLYRELLIKDQLIIIEGEVSIDEFSGGYRMLCREIFSIDQARARHAKYLRIGMPQYKAEEIERLATILEKYRGGHCHVMIDYSREDAAASLKLGDLWRIHPSDHLIETLRDMFVENTVEVVY